MGGSEVTIQEIYQQALDAYLMIGEENEKGEDEGKELLGGLLNKLKNLLPPRNLNKIPNYTIIDDTEEIVK